MSSKKKVIVTGASGFIGKAFLKAIDFDLYDVTVLTRNKKKKFVNEDNLTLVEGDLLDVESLKKAFQGNEILVNLAAEVRNESLLEKTNVLGTHNCIEAISSTSITRVIHLSSVGVLGIGFSSDEIIATEQMEPKPDNLYEVTKQKSEKIFLDAANANTFELVVLRPTNVFGEEHPFDAILNLMQHAKANKPLIYAKNARVNYVYVGDMALSLIHFISSKESKDVFHIGQSMLLFDFYTLLKLKLGSKSKLWRVPTIIIKLASMLGIKKLNTISNRVNYSDAKLKRIFSYPYGNEKGLESSIQYYRNKSVL